MEKVPSGYQNPQKWGPLGALGALWHAFGPPGGQKRGSWELLGPILVTVLAEGSILAPKREPVGPPRLPKWGQNGSKIHPKFVPNSIRFFVMFLDHFGMHFGSQNGGKFYTFFNILEEMLEICGHVVFDNPSTRKPTLWGSKGLKFREKWGPIPFWNGLFFYLIFGSVFVLSLEPFWSILGAKILQKCGLKVTCQKWRFPCDPVGTMGGDHLSGT